MSVEAGFYILVEYDRELIGAQRNASLKMDQEVIDITSKDSEWWKEHVAGFRTWSVDCDGLLFPGDTGNGQIAILTDLVEDRATYALSALTAPTVLISFYLNSTKLFSGQASVKSVEIGAPYQEAGTFKASFEGAGPLTLTGTF